MSTRDLDATQPFLRGPAGDAGGPDAWSPPAPPEQLLREHADEAEPPRAALTSGSVVGHFRIVAPLGWGGMGVVVRAVDESLGREVALKVLLPFGGSDTDRRRRILQEARAAAAVNHANIAAVHEVGEANGWIYIAMELIQGETLRQRLAARRLSIDEVVSVARQLLRGLAKAHAAGLIHRDLKPDNIMISDDGVAKVLDFGLAKQRRERPFVDKFADKSADECADDAPDSAANRHRQMGASPLRGTMPYLSPEQVHGAAVDQRADLFSFGMVVYEMLAGRYPFAASTLSEQFTAIVHAQPEVLTTLNQDVSPALSQLVKRCLAKRPEDRYPDCATLLQELERIFPAHRAPGELWSSPSNPDAALSTRSAEPQALGARRFWSLRRAAFAAGLATLLGLGIAGLGGAFHRAPSLAATPALPAPRPTAITELPLPSSASPAALAAYRAAMQSLHDGDWGRARANLRLALAADPSMAAAHLRLALTLDEVHATAESRESYARAVQGRASLSERDQAVLRALEPVLGHDPPGRALAAAHLREAAERYPLDAEIFTLLAYFEQDDRAAAMRAAERATELDPQYADAWQSLGEHLTQADRFEEALRAFDRCVATSPASVDCRGARALQYKRIGRCADMEDDLRRAIVASPKASVAWYDAWAGALFSLGRPEEPVLEALAQKWAQIPEEKRRAVELLDRAGLDFEAGKFARAEARLREGNRLIQADLDAMIHERYATLLVALHRETGRVREAARVADDYLKRQDLWQGSETFRNSTMVMLRAMLHAGALPLEAFKARRARWLQQGPELGDPDPGSLWFFAYANGIEQPEEAEEAILALAALPAGTLSLRTLQSHGAQIGKMYQLAQRPDEALPLLRPETQPCASPGDGHAASFYFGQALEQKGDTDAACAAYAMVLARWGNGKPRSVTGERARARTKALGCAGRR